MAEQTKTRWTITPESSLKEFLEQQHFTGRQTFLTLKQAARIIAKKPGGIRGLTKEYLERRANESRITKN